VTYRSGFVAVVGRPNVGKSTLINRICGEKISIVSDKPQTTRNRILAVANGEDYQIVFLDTPGIHKPRHKLGEHMMAAVRQSLEELDLVLMMVEAQETPGPGDRYVAAEVERADTPCLLVVNKIDLRRPDEVEAVARAYAELGRFAGVLPVSAAHGDGVEELNAAIMARLPEGPRYFPDDAITDQPERFIVAELVREKIFELTREEIPHSVAVLVEEMKVAGEPWEGREVDGGTEFEGGGTGSEDSGGTPADDDAAPAEGMSAEGAPRKVYISATIHVEKESQKGIIIGAGGRMLKEIGQRARRDIEGLLGSPVFLELWVKVTKGWRNEDAALRRLGYQTGERRSSGRGRGGKRR
jgi:GTP-binding protein Era